MVKVLSQEEKKNLRKRAYYNLKPRVDYLELNPDKAPAEIVASARKELDDLEVKTKIEFDIELKDEVVIKKK